MTEIDFRELVEHANDLIYTHDMLGRITWVNHAVERMLGWTPEEFLKLTVEQVVAPDFHDQAHRVMYERLTERFTPFTMVVVDKSGRR
ncbi:MAG: PAS domain S-box protein, partial [Deltaproteobacteria bacterium]|nr:PAS domain S-box protein [Deltaproteobacteria bacterium]